MLCAVLCCAAAMLMMLCTALLCSVLFPVVPGDDCQHLQSDVSTLSDKLPDGYGKFYFPSGRWACVSVTISISANVAVTLTVAVTATSAIVDSLCRHG